MTIKYDNETLARAFPDGITTGGITRLNTLIDDCDKLYDCKQCKKVFSDDDYDVIIGDDKSNLDFCSSRCLDDYYLDDSDDEHRLTGKELGLTTQY